MDEGGGCAARFSLLDLIFLCTFVLLVLLFCVAAVAFPFGFNIEDISGKYYQLPDSYHLGYSYYTFFASVVLLSTAVALINSDMIRLNFGG